MAAFSAPSAADIITYRYDVITDSVFGLLGSGATLSGEFSFNTDQSGTDLSFITNTKRFELSSLSLSCGGKSINSDQSDSWIVVGDDSPLFQAKISLLFVPKVILPYQGFLVGLRWMLFIWFGQILMGQPTMVMFSLEVQVHLMIMKANYFKFTDRKVP